MRTHPTQRATRKPVGRRILQQLYKWSVWRVPALACWYWLLALQSRELAIPCLNWIGILAFAPVFRHFLPPRWWRGFLALFGLPFYHFIIFPFIGIAVTARYVRRLFRIPPRVFRFATSTTAFVLSFFVFLILLFVIPGIRQPRWLVALGFIDLGIVNMLFICALSWACDPLAPMLRTFSAFWRGIEWFVENMAKENHGTDSMVETWKKFVISTRGFLTREILDENGNLKGLQRLRLAVGPFFAFVFVALFVILVTGYALSYYAFQNATGDLLNGIGSQPSFGLCWFYSLSVATTAPVSGIVPVRKLGYVLHSLELLNAVMFLSTVLFLFSYAMGDRGRESLRSLRDYPKRVVRKLDEWLEHLESLPPVVSDESTDAIDVESSEEE